MPLVSAACATVLLAAQAGSASAASPLSTAMRIVGDAHGFSAIAETITGHGTVVDTFRGALGTIKLAGLPGSTLSVEVAGPDPNGRGSIQVRLGTAAPKFGSGPSQARNLADLGIAGCSGRGACPCRRHAVGLDLHQHQRPGRRDPGIRLQQHLQEACRRVRLVPRQ